jgi:disulfide bond formation protein DsbB
MRALSQSRVLFGLIFLLCAGAMSYALYAEHVLKLDPCHLCILQRWAMIGLGAVALVAAVHGPGKLGARLYGVPAMFFAGAGAGVSGYHVYLQTLPPDQVGGCLAPMDMLLANNGIWATIKKVLMTATGDCAKIDWTFLGLSMPAWVFISFVVLTLLLVVFALFMPAAKVARAPTL